MPPFNCTWPGWKSIHYIIETWNLEKAAACGDLCNCVSAAVSATPYQVYVTKLPNC